VLRCHRSGHSENLRSSPSNRVRIVTVFPQGAAVEFLKRQTHYDRVRTESGKGGWIYERYLKEAVAPPPATTENLVPVTVSTAGVHVEAGAYHGCEVQGEVGPNGPHPADLEALNRLKNRALAPTDAEVNPNFTLANLLKPGDDRNRFDPASGAVLEGIVVNVKVGGTETVNCKATDKLYKDTHIEVARSMNAANAKRVIVEITPRWRAAMKQLDVDWSTTALQTLCGRRVKFVGWAFNAEHLDEAKNTTPNNPDDWRATVWEVHPVTSFEITGGRPKPCVP
jgi:SH3-like domain-containing protein